MLGIFEILTDMITADFKLLVADDSGEYEASHSAQAAFVARISLAPSSVSQTFGIEVASICTDGQRALKLESLKAFTRYRKLNDNSAWKPEASAIHRLEHIL